MKFTAEFNSLDEFNACCVEVARSLSPVSTAKAETKATEMKQRAKKEEPKEEPKPLPGFEKADPAEVPFTEDKPKEEVDVSKLQAEVRKLLTAVNKASDGNKASEIIKEITGLDKLTAVKDPEHLKALKARAEEELNG